MKAICYFDAKFSPQRISGTIFFSQECPCSPVIIDIDLKNFRKNQVHAIHIHELGNLTHGCHSTGNHFNPDSFVHGLYHKDHHAGDIMSNMKTNNNGHVRLTYSDHRISLFPGKYCIIGRSVVVHEYPDDLGNYSIYDQYTFRDLKTFAKQRGYMKKNKKWIHSELLSYVKEQSLQTGNAGGRMTCAIIGVNE